MKPFEEARAEVFSTIQLLDIEKVDLANASGRVLAEDVVASESVPPFENSAMDGFAVRGADVSVPGAILGIIADLPAGSEFDEEVAQGDAVRIMTGAPMPRGTDTVVKVEDTEEVNGKVRVNPAVDSGTAVRPAGGDVTAGETVFDAGTRLAPMHVGVLATLGVARPAVFRRPRVAYMSTGDELMPVETSLLGPGQIRDSNRPMLRALFDEVGVESWDLGTIPDDEDALRTALGRAGEADAVVTTGGVSMGDYDVTKLVLRESATVDFWRIAMQPAKPFGFGHVGSALFYGLPGNPVSALVSFEQFVRPSLLMMQGARSVLRPQITSIADEELVTDSAKTVFVRVATRTTLDGRVHVVRSGRQESNVLSAAAAADAFAIVPRGVDVIPAGGEVTVELFRSPESREYVDER